MAVVNSYSGEAMRPKSAEPGTRMRILTAAFHDDRFEGVNEYDDWNRSMTWTACTLRELLQWTLVGHASILRYRILWLFFHWQEHHIRHQDFSALDPYPTVSIRTKAVRSICLEPNTDQQGRKRRGLSPFHLREICPRTVHSPSSPIHLASAASD
jgi:hypothetical protein